MESLTMLEHMSVGKELKTQKTAILSVFPGKRIIQHPHENNLYI